jgi:hypothetical protein
MQIKGFTAETLPGQKAPRTRRAQRRTEGIATKAQRHKEKSFGHRLKD